MSARTATKSTRSVPPSGALTSRPADPTRGPGRAGRRPRRKLRDRIESFIGRMNMRSALMHRLSSMIWLPYAFRSGIKMKRVDEKTFTAVLPFRRFNKNWYNAMAGAALLGNSEIAGGMYVHGRCGGDYTVVCKHLEYKFLRPCFGPALYKIRPHEDLDQLVAAEGEFNLTLTLDIVQGLRKPGDKEKRVGRATATFHVTPKAQHRKREAKRRKSDTTAPARGEAAPETPAGDTPDGDTPTEERAA